MFENIPLEMRQFPQWILWRYEDLQSIKPTKIPYSITGKPASVTDLNTWTSYDQALYTLKQNPNLYSGLGFVLTENDPYCFIDLDDCKGDQSLINRQLKIFKEFNSYSEKSPSGNGLHIIIRGALPSGRRRSNVEIYSNVRYMTMTGNVYHNHNIEDKNDLVNALWSQMGEVNGSAQYYNGTLEETETDKQILNKAISASNGDKFKSLFEGNWQDFYQSQSEADFALVDILAFYTQNKKQIVRLFKRSGLGVRDKAKRVDYINYMLNKCFDLMLPPVDIDGLQNQLNEIIEKKQKKEIQKHPVHIDNDKPNIEEHSTYRVPPGLIGDITKFIFDQSPRQVLEISLVGAIGLMSGIVGRSYNVSNTGLNQYTLLLAETSVGKEAIAKGTAKLMHEVLKIVPAAHEFLGPGEIASHQALRKFMSKGPKSFVSVIGEFGLYIQAMGSIHAPSHLQGLRSLLLDLYNKSGHGNLLRKSIYSDKDKSTGDIQAPAFSIIGESTPGPFYDSLHEGLFREGFLPRFTIFECYKNRPPMNKNHWKAKVSDELLDKLSSLCAHSLMLNSQDAVIDVKFDNAAQKTIDAFDKHCDLSINSTKNEIVRQVWSRSHMKAMKLAAIVAVGLNPYEPTIDNNCVLWAIDVIVRDVKNMLKRFNAGEIGVDNDEVKQLNKVIEKSKEFVVCPWSEIEKYAKGLSFLHSDKIIPFAYLQRTLGAISIFRKDRIGANNALKRAISVLIERGDLQEVSRAVLSKKYGTSAKSYMISNLKAFDL